jgi:hypothetical protein
MNTTTAPTRRHAAIHMTEMTDAQRREDIEDITAVIAHLLTIDMVHTARNLSRIRWVHEQALSA